MAAVTVVPMAFSTVAWTVAWWVVGLVYLLGCETVSSMVAQKVADLEAYLVVRLENTRPVPKKVEWKAS